MGATGQSYRKHEVVRVESSHEEEHLRGMEAVIVSDRMTDSRGVAGYSAWVFGQDELWYFREQDVQPTGRIYVADGMLIRERRAEDLDQVAAEGVPS